MSISRRVARILIVSWYLLAGCAPDVPIIPPGDFGTRRPTDHVIVYTFPYAVQVGDTMTVGAYAYDRNGNGSAWNVAPSWSLSDSTLARTVGFGQYGAVLRGLRPGLLTVRATIEGRTGQDTVRIIPTLAPLEATPASLTLRLGDSAKVRLRITDLGGNAVPNLIVIWSSTNLNVAGVQCCRDSTMVGSSAQYNEPGTTLIRASVAHSVVSIPVVVTGP